MKSFLIDPFNQKIEVAIYSGDYKDISKIIEADSGLFDVVRLYANQDVAFVDDEGLYVEDQKFWIHKNYPTPLAGKALVLGTDDEGDSISPATSIEQLKDDIKFIGDRFELALLHKFHGDIDDYRPYFFESEKGAA